MPASLAHQIRLEISYRNRIAPFWCFKRFCHCLCVYVWLCEFTCTICMWIPSETRGHWVLRNWCLLWLLVINLDPLQEHQALLTIKTSIQLYPFWTFVLSSRDLNGFRCCLFYPQKKSVCLQSFKWSPNTEIWGKPWRAFSRLLLYLECSFFTLKTPSMEIKLCLPWAKSIIATNLLSFWRLLHTQISDFEWPWKTCQVDGRGLSNSAFRWRSLSKESDDRKQRWGWGILRYGIYSVVGQSAVG